MSDTIRQPIARWTAAEEGQFFERKSALDRSSGRVKPRKAAEIAHDIAETVCAMANADGGELVVGMEDDGAISGVPHAEDKLQLLLGVPKDRNYVNPPLPCRSRKVVSSDGLVLLHFEADWSPAVHLLADSRCLLRVDDTNSPFAPDKVGALKAAKAQGLLERSFPPGAQMEDLDLDLVSTELGKVWPGLSPEAVLRRYGLIAGRNGHSVPTLAALLLFGREPTRWHPRCGLDFIRWEGTQGKTGSELNIAKRIRIEEPLAVLIRKAREAIHPFIRERQHLHDLFFVEKLEYPTFAWQEAIVNAVAHRDYSLQGAPIEVWMYDDRMEIRSPGMPPAPVTVDALNHRKRVHLSRNPILVRALADLQYMRDVGEGVPRIFDEMDRAGCYPPRFEIIGGFVFQLTLRNEPVYDRKTLDWLKQFTDVDLSGDQKRMLAYAHAHGERFTSREFQKVIGTDIYGASNAIKDMIRKGVAKSTEKGSRVYGIHKPLREQPGMPTELRQLLPLLRKKGRLANQDVRKICGLTKITAARLLRELTSGQWLAGTGKRGAGAWYSAGPRLLSQSQTSSESRETDTMSHEADTMKKRK